MTKNKPKKSKQLKGFDGFLTIKISTAGIGGQFFRAYFEDTPFNRSHGSDDATFSTPGDALAALGKALDRELASLAWFWSGDNTAVAVHAAMQTRQRVVDRLYGEDDNDD